jgi:hypothetical protein
MSSDRRRALRASADWPATLEPVDGGDIVNGHVVDVSASGFRVRLSDRPPLGEAVFVTVDLSPVADALQVVARVVRHTSDGVGVNFVGLPASVIRSEPSLLSAADKRRAPRALANLTAALHRASYWVHSVRVLDISQFAVRVAIDMPLGTGLEVSLVITPDDGSDPIELPAMVSRQDHRGTVLLFLSLPEATLLRLATLVSGLLRRAG